MIPPKIQHLHTRSTDCRESLVSLCSSALHLCKGEEALLRFYAAMSDGFRPAVKFVMRKTGLSRCYVFKLRNQLIEHGLIAVTDDAVYIDWNRVRLFSTLDPELTRGKCFYAVCKKIG